MKITKIETMSMTTGTGRNIEHYNVEFKPEIDKYRNLNYQPKKRAHFKGFIPYLSELFDKLCIPNQCYENSAVIEVNGKTMTIFQNKKNNLWFYFSDIFKARNFKNFLARLKNYLLEKIGNKVIEIFKTFEEELYGDFEEVVEKQKKDKVKKIIRKDRDGVYANFFGLFSIKINPYRTPRLTFTVNMDIYRQYKEKLFNYIVKLAEELAIYMSFFVNRKEYTFTIREQKAFMLEFGKSFKTAI